MSVPSGDAIAYRRHKLGAPHRRPRIVGIYEGQSGWRAISGHRLDDDTARSLLAEGITIVRVRRIFSKVEVRLRNYLGTGGA